MKKALSILLALCFLLGTVPMFASATDGDFVIEDGVLTKYTGSGGRVIIPTEVTKIGNSAFRFCNSVTDIIIPSSVTSIGEDAFYYCRQLKSIIIPDSVTSIGKGAFFSCTSLTNINIPDSVTNIGAHTFFCCYNLASVKFPNSITSIADTSFWWCIRLTSVTIPNGITRIGAGAFNKCSSLESITIPLSVKNIDWGAFSECEALKNIYYDGTKEQWQQIDIDTSDKDGLNNNPLLTATIHYTNLNPDIPPAPPTPSTSFTDVKPGAYYAEPVNWAVENGITAGTGNGKFSPEKTCTRDQIVTFLYRSNNSPEVDIIDRFTDMPNPEEIQRAISWAVQSNITVGYGNGKFLPKKGCTRAEAMTFIWRAAGKPEPSKIASFSDMPSNSDFQKAISWAAENGITSGIGGNRFGPDKTCTRGQIVTFLYNAKDL